MKKQTPEVKLQRLDQLPSKNKDSTCDTLKKEIDSAVGGCYGEFETGNEECEQCCSFKESCKNLKAGG